jgi:hypothetical protein
MNPLNLQQLSMLSFMRMPSKGEPCVRLVHQRFLGAPWFLKPPQRMAALVLLSLVGALVAGLSERQGRRARAARQRPITGWRPAGRAPVHPTVARLFMVCADESLGQGKEAPGRVGEPRFARLTPGQAPILTLLGLPQPAEWFGQSGRA